MGEPAPAMNSEVETAKAQRQRDPRLDVVKGLAIVLVVLGHVVRGLMEPGLVSAHSGIGELNERVLYLITLPLFVFTSGLLMPAGVRKRGSVPYLKMRVLDLLWVYLLWTLLQGAVEVFTSSVKNVPTTWTQVFTLWVPRAQLWYLPFLALVTFGTVIVRPWATVARLWTGLVIALTCTILMWGRDGSTIATRGMSLVVFLALGAAIGAVGLRYVWDRCSRLVLLILGLAGLGLTTALGLGTAAVRPTADLEVWTIEGTFLGLVGSLSGVAGMLLLGAVLVGFPWVGPALAYLGRHSMAIYLGHITVMAAVRIVLLRLGIESVPLHVVAGTLVGTVASLLIVWAGRRFPWLLRAPRL